MIEHLSREQLGERINFYPYSAYARAMLDVEKFREGVGKVGFNSDVYFVRSALEKKFNVVYPLPYVQMLMKEMGWVEGAIKRRKY